MPTFSLITHFDKTSLDTLYATGTNVVVAKPNAGGLPNVAWIVFRPIPKNTLTWEEKYGLYASTSKLENGAVLTQIATEPNASAGQKYSFVPQGYFGPAQSGGTPGSYTIFNDYNNLPPSGPGYFTMGLFQDATANNTSMTGNAVSAAPVPYQSTAVITPFTTVYIWLQSQVKSNTVVTDVTSVQTAVPFGGNITEVQLQYDPTTGGFVRMGGSLKLDEKSGKLLAQGGEALPPGLSLDWVLPRLG